MICLYHGAIIYVCNSALSSYIHITTVEVVQSNEPWRMSAGCRRSCCTLMTPSSEYEELRSSLTWILQSLILPAKKHEIPGYDTYKTSFACCDDFNKGLHDKIWPHKRGGSGHKGFEGKINDFIMAVMLENTYNSWHQITGTSPREISFKLFCCTLADQLWKLKCNNASSYYQGSTGL